MDFKFRIQVDARPGPFGTRFNLAAVPVGDLRVGWHWFHVFPFAYAYNDANVNAREEQGETVSLMVDGGCGGSDRRTMVERYN